MQFAKNHLKLPGKSVLTVLLIGLVLLLNAMAAAPALHALLHRDADKADHQCAVTLFAHGKLEAATPVVPMVVPSAAVAAVFRLELSVSDTTVELLPPGRAPPVLASPQV